VWCAETGRTWQADDPRLWPPAPATPAAGTGPRLAVVRGGRAAAQPVRTQGNAAEQRPAA
jgi:hypothetical protein